MTIEQPAPAECHLCSRAMSDHPGGVYCPIPEPLPAPTGPGAWWAKLDWRGYVLVRVEPSISNRIKNGWLEEVITGTRWLIDEHMNEWIPLVAPTAKGGE